MYGNYCCTVQEHEEALSLSNSLPRKLSSFRIPVAEFHSSRSLHQEQQLEPTDTNTTAPRPTDTNTTATNSTTLAADPHVLTVVKTAEELRKAIISGVAHIELQNHLDLISEASTDLGKVSFKTFRVRFRCLPSTIMHMPVIQ